MLDLSERHLLQHFRDSYEELVVLSTDNAKDYDLNKVAAILRRFLLDEKQIISAVGKVLNENGYRVSKVSYPARAYIAPRIPGLQFGGIYDDFEIPNATPSFSVDLFLKLKVGIVEGIDITVKDLIKYVANKDGSVHYDQNNLEGNDILFQQLQYEFKVGGNSALSKMLSPIARSVCNGLRDTYNKTVSLLEVF